MMVSGGGTGGHLFPGIAVAEAVLQRMPGSEVLFVGTARATDARVLADRPFKTTTIHSQGLKGKGLFGSVRSLLQLPFSLFEAAGKIADFKPSVVLGVGGYVTGPVLLAARLKGIATCIHEQNSVPGLANRALGKFVERIFLSIPGSEKYFSGQKCVMTGNPVREELLQLAKKNTKKIDDKITLLVLGGSLGARRVNTLVIEALSVLKDKLPAGFRVIHQTGSVDEQMVAETYKSEGIRAEVSAFFNNMTDVYSRADLLVSRAGATSLAEMTVLARPMILIPYPYAADNHQEKNGEYLVQAGAARMLIEKETSAGELADKIFELLTDRDKREKMGRAAASLARPEATEMIVVECLRLAGARSQKPEVRSQRTEVRGQKSEDRT